MLGHVSGRSGVDLNLPDAGFPNVDLPGMPNLPDGDLQDLVDVVGGGLQGASDGLGGLLDAASSAFDSIDFDF